MFGNPIADRLPSKESLPGGAGWPHADPAQLAGLAEARVVLLLFNRLRQAALALLCYLCWLAKGGGKAFDATKLTHHEENKILAHNLG